MEKILNLNPEIPTDFIYICGDFSFISAVNQKLTAYNRMGNWNTILSEDYIAYMEFNERLNSF